MQIRDRQEAQKPPLVIWRKDMDVTITSNADAFKDGLRDALPKILESWGIVAEGYAKLNCPVDTGRLRNSITHERDDEEGQVQIGTNVEYAPYVEYGTSRMKAQPYLEPAILDNISEYQNIADEYLRGE